MKFEREQHAVLTAKLAPAGWVAAPLRARHCSRLEEVKP